jgi:hypothetical protein
MGKTMSMPLRAMIYFALAFVAVLTALLLMHGRVWPGRVRDIDLQTAAGRANRLLAVYVHDSGEPPMHFIAAGVIAYADGWEFAWRYRPCPAIAALKIFIGKSGSATYSALPDCTPRRGYAVGPGAV